MLLPLSVFRNNHFPVMSRSKFIATGKFIVSSEPVTEMMPSIPISLLKKEHGDV